jgi:UDP-N-acetylenolpyruvoylglucosamine reductase
MHVGGRAQWLVEPADPDELQRAWVAARERNFMPRILGGGANLIIREPQKVEFFFEDSDNVRKNKVTVRIEERVAFPIYGDNYFLVGEFAGS